MPRISIHFPDMILEKERQVPSPRRFSVDQLGFIASILTLVFAGAFFIAGIFTPARGGNFCTSSCISYPYVNGVSSFIPSDYIWQYPPFLLALSFVVLVACVHQRTPDDAKVFSQIGLSFASIYAAVVTIDYFIQWTVVEPSVLSGQTAGLSLFSQYNPHGVLVSLESLGYLMMSVSLLFMAFVFGRGRLESAIRWLFVAGFVLTVGFLVGFSLLGYDIVAFEVAVITVVCIVSVVGGVLLSIFFRRRSRAHP